MDDSLAGIVSVIGLAGLARSNRSVIDQVQEVLAVAGNDSHLLAVLTECIELVLEGSLDLLTGDVRELSLRYKGLGLSTNQFLLENNNAGRFRVLVLELGNFVGDLLLACTNM